MKLNPALVKIVINFCAVKNQSIRQTTRKNELKIGVKMHYFYLFIYLFIKALQHKC